MKRKTVNADVYSYQGVKSLIVDGEEKLLHFFVKHVEGQVDEYVFYPECKYVSDKLKKTIYLNPIEVNKNSKLDATNRLLAYSNKLLVR